MGGLPDTTTFSNSLFLDKLILGPIASWVISAPRYVEQTGWDEFLKRPVGTGPYIVEGVVKDYREVQEGEVYATLVANPDYWNWEEYKKMKTPKERIKKHCKFG